MKASWLYKERIRLIRKELSKLADDADVWPLELIEEVIVNVKNLVEDEYLDRYSEHDE